jgi:type IX secretion system PorP/SprF family membrane protein
LSQYSGNLLVFNPAYAGFNGELSMNLTARKHWVNIPGSPSLISYNAHGKIAARHAWGLVVQHETWAALSGTFAYGNYGYTIPMSRDALLSFGFQAGAYHHVLDYDKIQHKQPGDPVLDEGRIRNTKLDVNVGAYFLTRQYYLGFSVKHLAPPKLSFSNIVSNEEWYPYMGTQFFAMGGLVLPINRDWSLRPEFFTRYVNTTPFTINAGLLGVFRNSYYLGAHFQTGQKTLSFSVRGLIMEGLFLGYSYDMPLGVIRTAQSGSHEISITYLYHTFVERRTGGAKW